MPLNHASGERQKILTARPCYLARMRHRKSHRGYGLSLGGIPAASEHDRVELSSSRQDTEHLITSKSLPDTASWRAQRLT